MIVLPAAYFPPIPWFGAVLGKKEVLIEIWQHYRKQQYTSRMFIRSANRVLPLSIPVARRGRKMSIKDKKISYQEDWQKQHWISLLSAYRNSPYFLYYEDELQAIYQSKPVYLLEFQQTCLDFLLQKLNLSIAYSYTNEYQEENYYGEKDLRRDFGSQPSDSPDWYNAKSYPQVFEGFEPGLSALDLLFNEGPESQRIIKEGMISLQ
ncbi:MAG: WbqC family protein [Bacteroidia bacterium]|nr:WbqC family protein [Bacteroidia bacterium]